MDFGRIKDAGKVDFSLPPDHPATFRVLAKGAGGPSPAVPDIPAISAIPDIPALPSLRAHVGCPVWQDDAMARKLCPPRTPKSKRLACYGRQFNALELNSTGYGLDRERVMRWSADVPEGFRFCPKVPMEVTHGSNLDWVKEAFARHCEDAQAFGKRLGTLFLQFPELFGPDRFAELERLLATRRSGVPLAVEVRHAAWFREGKWKDRLGDMLEAQGVTAILTDTPGRRDALHQRLTTSTAFIRFNGQDMERDRRRLEDWAGRIRTWMGQGLRDLYFFTHMDPVDMTVELSTHLIKSLNAAAGLGLKEPLLQEELEEPSLGL